MTAYQYFNLPHSRAYDSLKEKDLYNRTKKGFTGTKI